ncbi:alpha/beta hydrolase [Burkholderia multivorans]|uniref:alpha/beta hydrolase n=1 Tax=Burkholderia multivorans TaxID=87883 RepID=UPI00123C1A35|nr:alpha/beta hydrolase [Burkholderia multivorans]MBU9247003.1 alpha/beta hydrolase [Burkholderia multivorans]MCL4626534.1 alpha/beta hydrolase [Burkholderia multivorans]MCO1362293.1 alpha/beta hydrolase [Burkholderia multivorans]MCO1422064.1 alpha/beta hydrolase [Burkholderia multivorans]QET30460.1 alpha/beta hydrolase [Burkholderia multivorans]
MNQKFGGEIGQVAGGDVKSNSAQTSVNVHFHGGEPKADATKFITDKQRAAIARRAFEIEAKTGTDKLMVYRRLKTVFGFEFIEQMPRSTYERAIKYLDSWIRNGNLGHPPAPSGQQKIKHPTSPAPTVHCESPVPQPQTSVPIAVTPALAASAMSPALVQQNGKRPRRGAMALAVIAVIVAAAGAYFYVERHRTDVVERVQAAEPVHCEYGGDRYSPGSIVMQVGVRRQCVAADGVAAWQKADVAVRR